MRGIADSADALPFRPTPGGSLEALDPADRYVLREACREAAREAGKVFKALGRRGHGAVPPGHRRSRAQRPPGGSGEDFPLVGGQAPPWLGSFPRGETLRVRTARSFPNWR